MALHIARETLTTAAGQPLSARYLRPGRIRLRTPLFILGVGILGYVIWISSSKPPRPSNPAENPLAGLFNSDKSEPKAELVSVPAQPAPAPAPQTPIPVDLTPPKTRPVVGPSGTHIERSSNTTIQWADKLDPSRLAGEFGYISLEPLEAKRYFVQSPHAWMFLKDGWSIHIQSDSGHVYMPDEDSTRRPESGTLRGNVLIRAFRPRADGTHPDPAKDEAYLTAQTDSLSFDGSLGEISTVDRLTARWPQGYFAGRGLTAIYNEIKSRLEFAEVKEGEEIILRPESNEQKVSNSAPAKSLPANTQAPPPNPAARTNTTVFATAPDQTLYRAVFTSDIRITQDQRFLTADQLELWAKLIDGRFAPDAFGSKSTAIVPSASKPSTEANSSHPPASVPVSPPAAHPPEQADIRITWTGPFQLRTSDTSFPQLEHDSLAMRFASAKSGTVTAVDPALGATAQCASLDYFASRRQIKLEGLGPSGVTIAIENAGTATGSVLTADLARGSAIITGSGKLQGAGALAIAQTAAPRATQPTVTWSEQAEFLFDQSIASSRLKEAIFTGDVAAVDGDSVLSGSFVRAEFTSLENKSSIISRITVQDRALVSAGLGTEITADHIDASFLALTRKNAESTGAAIESLQARGNVSAHRAADQIDAGSLDVRFIIDPSESNQIATLVARDDVRLVSTDLRASGSELSANIPAQIADLLGSASKPASATRGPTTISGTALKMDGVARTIAVTGAGTLKHIEAAKTAGNADSRITATWTSSLAFDDRLGSAFVVGDVAATSFADAASVDIMKSQSLDLAFTPFAELTPGAPESKDPPPPRELLKIIAIGTDDKRATLESRRFDPAESGPLETRLPQRVTYLEGARIITDTIAGTLDVPVGGKLLVSDRRSGAVAQSSGSFAGDALFKWNTSLNVRRNPAAADTADMLGNVEVIHLRPGDKDPTELRCDKITATMRPPPNAQSPASEDSTQKNELTMRGEISRMLATGGVWARSASKREISSDIMDYDAASGLILLTSNDGREIQAFDPASGTPIRGKSLEWDLKLDRIRVRDVGGITVPR